MYQSSSTPTVGVVIPCFGAGPFLLEAVQSALDQTGDFDLLEIIVVDDRSTDEPTRIALQKVTQWSCVRVITNDGQRGSAAARNAGVRQCTSDWIVFLDADDWLLPESIQNRLAALDEFPAAIWIGGDFDEQMRDGKLLPEGRFERNLENYSFLKPAFHPLRKPLLLRRPLQPFLSNAPTNTITGLLKREAFMALGGYSAQLLRQQDYHLFLRLAASHDFIFVPQKVARVRHHANNSTRSITETQSWRVKALSALRPLPEFEAHRDEITTKIASLHVDNSYHHRRDGHYLKAATEALRALRTRPWNLTAWRSLLASAIRRN